MGATAAHTALAQRSGDLGYIELHVPDTFTSKTMEAVARGLLVGLDLVHDRNTKAPAPGLAWRVARTCLELGMMTSVVRGGLGIFRIAPLHHHFELVGWAEEKITVRFWIVAALAGLLGFSVFLATYQQL